MHLFISSEFFMSEVWIQHGWVLSQVSHRLKLGWEMGYIPFWRFWGKICYLAHSDYWLNSAYFCRSEVPVSLLAVRWGLLSASQAIFICHVTPLSSNPAMEDLSWLRRISSVLRAYLTRLGSLIIVSLSWSQLCLVI